MTDKELCISAIKATENSYSPYSKCKVGAALLCESKKVFHGCNIENATYGATNCAERTAFFSAVASGENAFEKIAICGIVNDAVCEDFLPCGICRQVMSEFCSPDFEILIVNNSYADFDKYYLKDLLPKAFRLNKKS